MLQLQCVSDNVTLFIIALKTFQFIKTMLGCYKSPTENSKDHFGAELCVKFQSDPYETSNLEYLLMVHFCDACCLALG